MCQRCYPAEVNKTTTTRVELPQGACALQMPSISLLSSRHQLGHCCRRSCPSLGRMRSRMMPQVAWALQVPSISHHCTRHGGLRSLSVRSGHPLLPVTRPPLGRTQSSRHPGHGGYYILTHTSPHPSVATDLVRRARTRRHPSCLSRFDAHADEQHDDQAVPKGQLDCSRHDGQRSGGGLHSTPGLP